MQLLVEAGEFFFKQTSSSFLGAEDGDKVVADVDGIMDGSKLGFWLGMVLGMVEGLLLVFGICRASNEVGTEDGIKDADGNTLCREGDELKEGNKLGCLLGSREGNALGWLLGSKEGEELVSLVCSEEGNELGSLLSSKEGNELGCLLGWREGNALGCLLGSKEGNELCRSKHPGGLA